MRETFGEDYFMRGQELGLSNYTAYSWLPELTLAMADHLKKHLHIQDGDSVYDFGCSRGYLIKALNMLGVKATGYDISRWAIENCDEGVKGLVSNTLSAGALSRDFVISKDCMEHIPLSQLNQIIPKLCDSCRKSLLFIVPLTAYSGGAYVRKEDEMDSTHLIRYTLPDWLLLLAKLAPDFTVSGSYHIEGLKPASSQVPQSCGFFTLQRND